MKTKIKHGGITVKTKNGLLASVFCLLVVALCVIGLTSCDMAMFCTHEWSEYTVIEDATCSKAGIQQRTCGKCGLTETAEIAKIEHTVGPDDGDCATPINCMVCGEIAVEGKEHAGGKATCIAKAKCFYCGKEYGEVAGHVPGEDDGDCTTPVTCTLCGDTVIEAHLGHILGKDDGDCTTPVTCINCDTVMIEAKPGHRGTADGDCTTPEYCEICGKVYIEAEKEHRGGFSTCYTLACCTLCGKAYGEYAEHTPCEDDGDCTTSVWCLVCGNTIVEAQRMHIGGKATCNALAKCDICGMEYGEFASHKPGKDDGDCTTPITCMICGDITTDAQKAHIPNADDGDCTTAVTCSICGAVTTEANETHRGGSANCSAKAHCEVCGKEYGDFAGHIPNADDGDCTTAIT